MNLPAVIFGISHRVTQPMYAIVGAVLMTVKYLIELAVVFKLTGLFYYPWAFLIPSYTMREGYFNAAPDWLIFAMIAWSIPFLWIAVTMSVRRGVDAGISPWFGLLVIVPVANIFVMLVLASVPSASTSVDVATDEPESRLPGNRNSDRPTPKSETRLIYSAILGVVVGGLMAVVSTIISATMMHNYGNSLFLGMPIVAGAVAGFVYNQPDRRSITGSMAVGTLSVLIGGVGLLLFAVEGVICLVMAFPLIVPLGALGGILGWFLASAILIQSKWMITGGLIFVPLLGWIESRFKSPEIEVVQSSIVVDCSPEKVWENVVSFPDIDSPPAWYFRLGVASPLRATIDGKGIGAVRQCEFTTGSFVEPITVWNPPNRLAFDVTQQPDPLVELSPYRHIRPPHLQHSFYSVKGEFELIVRGNGQTELIGRTWYTIDMGPRVYWRIWTDAIIHRIHMRVLDHIANTAESKP